MNANIGINDPIIEPVIMACQLFLQNLPTSAPTILNINTPSNTIFAGSFPSNHGIWDATQKIVSESVMIPVNAPIPSACHIVMFGVVLEDFVSGINTFLLCDCLGSYSTPCSIFGDSEFLNRWL